jgi:hypothetical protein
VTYTLGEAAMKITKWSKFDNRGELKNTQFPGVYALAISVKNIAGTPFDYRKEIVYFGFTNSAGGLRSRLNAFNNTLRDKSGPGHGGAERFRYDYKNGDALAKKLYVAVWPFKCNVSSNTPRDLRTMGAVVRAEYLAFAEYVERFGALPKYNDKKNSPKLEGL